MKPRTDDHTLNQLEASGLRGRGGGWFETYRKWCAVLAEDGRPLVIANGGEGEPGSIKDRFVMRARPKDVLLGLKIAMDVLGAERGYVYLRGSFGIEEELLRKALQDLGLASIVSLHRGDDSYVGGEETALLESIEGRTAWPRPKPPRPSAVGLFGRPTLVQNVDTLARVPGAVNEGSAFAATETLTLTLWGDVRSPGAYEVRTNRALRDVIDTEGGGATSPVGLVFPSGVQSMPLTPAQLDVELKPAAIEALGSALGTASILVLGEDTSWPSIVDAVARFFERESCGQCPPCVLGARNLRGLIAGDRPSANRLTPHSAIRETAAFMSMHGYCSHSRAGADAVTGLFTRWQGEIIERLRGVPTRPGARERDPFAPEAAERRALDDFLNLM
ncbi:MAG: hypothetical protein JJE39_05350 [Vicinamibacteria bacterium]|nr:hypothetical protein [Vicinamibacteria bacterium]